MIGNQSWLSREVDNSIATRTMVDWSSGSTWPLSDNPSAVRCLGTVIDGQTDSVKKKKIVCPSSARPLSAVRWLGTTIDGQTDSVKKNRIRLSVVIPSAVAGSERRLTARQIQSKRTEFVCPSSTRRCPTARKFDGQTTYSLQTPPNCSN